MKNILSIDVEDYYMVSAFSGQIPFASWNSYESRVERNTERILSLLDKFNVKATFFVLGWIGERCPKLVKEIFEEGHEIASHGYAHKLIHQQEKDEFIEDIKKSKKILEDIICQPVLGYRAPSFSITKDSLWAIDCLIDADFKYDSSVFPIHHDKGGLPQAERFPFKIIRCRGEITEIPLSTKRILGANIPVAGGGYFRFLPYQITKKCISGINACKQPGIVYLHPWELDINQPRISTSWLSKFRHYININKTENRLRQLLTDFEFEPIREMIIKNERTLKIVEI